MRRRSSKNKKILSAVLTLAAALFAAFYAASGALSPDRTAEGDAPAEAGRLAVYFLDVGQGDSELIRLPDGRAMLIDAGNPENGPQIVDALQSLGIEKIDTLIATHPHADHIGGMARVVRSVTIGGVYMPKVSANTKTFEDLLDAIRDRGLGIRTAKAGVKLYDGGGFSAVMLAPVGSRYDDLNQYSAVVRLTYGKTSFLFTGDAGKESEKQMTGTLRSDVLKVGHHGSPTATSDDFLGRVSPAYAVIEVGKDNPYGLPAASTLQKLRKAGVRIYRTDEDGTVRMVSDGNTISVEKHVGFPAASASSLKPAA